MDDSTIARMQPLFEIDSHPKHDGATNWYTVVVLIVAINKVVRAFSTTL